MVASRPSKMLLIQGNVAFEAQAWDRPESNAACNELRNGIRAGSKTSDWPALSRISTTVRKCFAGSKAFFARRPARPAPGSGSTSQPRAEEAGPTLARQRASAFPTFQMPGCCQCHELCILAPRRNGDPNGFESAFDTAPISALRALPEKLALARSCRITQF